MTNTNFRGPVNSMGAMEDATSGADDGPSLTYQGTMFPSLRDTLFAKDGVGAGPSRLGILTIRRLWSWIISRRLRRRRFIAVANSSAVNSIANGVALVLNTTAAGNAVAGTPSWASGVPIIPFGVVCSGYGGDRFGFRVYDRDDHGG